MIVEKLTIKGIEGHRKWFSSSCLTETMQILTENKWEQENKLRIITIEGFDAIARRGKDSLAKLEHGIGTLVNDQRVYDNVVYTDDPFWNSKFGKTCVYTPDAIPYQLYMKGKRKDLHPMYTQKNLISKIAMGRVLDTMGIQYEFMEDADIILLPSRDKFSCGFSRIGYCDPNKKELDDDVVRYEGGWITFYMDHTLFQKILPNTEYTRANSKDPNHGGIDGIKNKHPSFNREQFYTLWFQEIANILHEDNITIIETTLEP